MTDQPQGRPQDPEPQDPATDPDRDLSTSPQDPEAVQPGETPEDRDRRLAGEGVEDA